MFGHVCQWRDQPSIEQFLSTTRLGRVLAGGWHVRLSFVRRWEGHRACGLPECERVRYEPADSSVTLARMKMLQVPRFLRWGKPVERFVRDHTGVTLATTTIRIRTIQPFRYGNSARHDEHGVGQGDAQSPDITLRQ